MPERSQIFVDAEVRMATFDWLSRQVNEHGDVIPRTLLAKGFDFHGQRVPLVGPQGIFKPKIIQEIPLSITTAPHGPYDDSFGTDGFLRYKYRGQNPDHHENVGLRKAYRYKIPLVYFHGIVPGKYLPIWPVFIVGDNPGSLSFKVAVDDISYIEQDSKEQDNLARRIYITSTIRNRLHQRGFRERVLEAYKEQCALCKLRHRELLDAAHIVPDSEPGGEPTVKNGIAFCKLHHAAFDRFFIGIRPDYVIVLRNDILRETDGPMLQHGLQGLHNKKLIIPNKQNLRPDPKLLSWRWERFRNVA
jgi:putative restriction endonuclease